MYFQLPDVKSFTHSYRWSANHWLENPYITCLTFLTWRAVRTFFYYILASFKIILRQFLICLHSDIINLFRTSLSLFLKSANEFGIFVELCYIIFSASVTFLTWRAVKIFFLYMLASVKIIFETLFTLCSFLLLLISDKP